MGVGRKEENRRKWVEKTLESIKRFKVRYRKREETEQRTSGGEGYKREKAGYREKCKKTGRWNEKR